MFEVRKGTERGHFNHGWLDTYHTFAFGDYPDPRHVSFRALRVTAIERESESVISIRLDDPDGSVTLRVPQGFAADLDVHTSDGHVDCALPLTMDHYQSSGGDGHALHGRLNGGGAPLTIHTSDGSVKIEQI